MSECMVPGCDWPRFVGPLCYRHENGRVPRGFTVLSETARSLTSPADVVAYLLEHGWTRAQVGERVLVKTTNLRELQALVDETAPSESVDA